MDMRGKVAAVLGASAAGGTGWALAELLAAEGAKVVVGARRLEPLQELARKIGGHAVACDAGQADQIEYFAKSAAETFGKIDLAVNCAFLPSHGFIRDIDDAEIRSSLEINFIAHLYFIRHLAEVMNDGGAITLVSTSAADKPVHGRVAYGCSKAAMDCLVRYAAVEYGPRRIRVNSVLPGPIKTDASARLYEKQPGREAAFEREIPLGRVGLPSDYATMILALYKAEFITGVNLPAGGGIHLNRAPRPDEIPASG